MYRLFIKSWQKFRHRSHYKANYTLVYALNSGKLASMMCQSSKISPHIKKNLCRKILDVYIKMIFMTSKTSRRLHRHFFNHGEKEFVVYE